MNTSSVIYVGTGEFGVSILNTLAADKRIQIPFVITGQDKPSGRHLEMHGSAVKETALKNKLIVHQSNHITELKQKIIQANPDFLLVCSFGEIIPLEILKIPKFGSVNIHGSLLPKYRGASPIQEALRHGDTITGITWTLMNEKMDAGEIIEKRELKINPEDNYETLWPRMSELAAEATFDILMNFVKTCKKTPQDESKATYCRKIKKQDGEINVMQESATEIVNKIRAYTPWPGCFIFWNGKRLKIIQAITAEQKISSGVMGAGEVKILNGNILAIGTRKGAVSLLRVQMEGKREMGIEEFLRGQRNIPEKITNNELKITN